MSTKRGNWLLDRLYHTKPGRVLLNVLVQPGVSRLVGRWMDSGMSRLLISPFIHICGMDMSDYESREFRSYNDFFTRRMKKNRRPVEQDRHSLISPCDGAALVLPIRENSTFFIKRSQYNLRRLLRSRKLAEKYQGGTAVVLRLSVKDYHRYCYVDHGMVTDYRNIPGVFHTVQPVAVEREPVFHENTREYCTLHSENFGDIIVMEIGALLVGKIVNDKKHRVVKKGEEKGRFEFGGSTVVLILEKNAVRWSKEMLLRSARGEETSVKMGEVIGIKE